MVLFMVDVGELCTTGTSAVTVNSSLKSLSMLINMGGRTVSREILWVEEQLPITYHMSSEFTDLRPEGTL